MGGNPTITPPKEISDEALHFELEGGDREQKKFGVVPKRA